MQERLKIIAEIIYQCINYLLWSSEFSVTEWIKKQDQITEEMDFTVHSPILENHSM
jgi:hypothetical protein